MIGNLTGVSRHHHLPCTKAFVAIKEPSNAREILPAFARLGLLFSFQHASRRQRQTVVWPSKVHHLFLVDEANVLVGAINVLDVLPTAQSGYNGGGARDSGFRSRAKIRHDYSQTSPPALAARR